MAFKTKKAFKRERAPCELNQVSKERESQVNGSIVGVHDGRTHTNTCGLLCENRKYMLLRALSNFS